MRLFRVMEEIRTGLPIRPETPFEGGTARPQLVGPQECTRGLRLNASLETACRKAAVPLKLSHARGEVDGSTIHFHPSIQEDGLALVHLMTYGGVGGKIRLTASSYDAVLTADRRTRKERIEHVFHPFPDPGVTAFCTPQELARVRDGVPSLDLLLLLRAGGRFRMQRTGQLEGASRWMDVLWNGSVLRIRSDGPTRTSTRLDPYAGWRAPLPAEPMAAAAE